MKCCNFAGLRDARLASFLGMAVFILSLAASAQVYTFNAASYGVGNNPQAAATGDFNGDGRLDLAVVNLNDNKVSVLLGKSDGGFQPRVDYTVGNQPVSVIAADVNGDNKLDIITVNANCTSTPCTQVGSVSVLLGNGDGTFQAQVKHGVGHQPTGVAAADLDRNGTMDLVACNGQDNNVTVMLGHNDGTFTTLRSLPVGTNPRGIVIGDFNGDLKPDVVVANAGDGSIGLLKGNGNATFNNMLVFATGPTPVALAIGDYNEDGKPDIVTSNAGNSTVSLLINNQFFGTPGFLKHVDLSTTAKGTGIVTGDFDGDGHDDIAAIASGTDSVSVLTGKGDGTMNFRVDFATGPGPISVAAGDFTGDGRLDLVTVNNADNSVSVIPSIGQKIFQSRIVLNVGAQPSSVAAANFDGDSNIDLAVVDRNDNSVMILKGAGDGTFTQGTPLTTGAKPSSVLAADLDHDTKMDLVVTNATDNTISVYKGRGDGTFSAPHNYNVGKKPVDVIAADVDNNGTLDLIVVDQNDLNIAILKGNGDATFQPAKFNSTGAGSNPISVVAGDFGTGHIDLAVANNGSGNVAVLLNTGNGTYASPVMYPTGTGPSSITSGDFNGDGLADLAVTNNGSGNVSILLGSGGGAFQAHVDYPTGKGPWFVTTGHFNADSNLDLAIGSAISASNRVTILLGDGQGHFVGRTDHATSFLLGGQTAALAVADFNGDGADDIAMADQLANKVSVFLNSAVPVASPAFIAFGNQNVGIASTPVTVNFTNSGGAPLGNVSAATSGTDFSQADTCPQTLAPTDTCTAQVTFDPTDVGLRLGSLVFTDNAITGTQKVPLGGTGNGSGAQLSVPSLSFPVTLVGTTSITQKVTLTNYGNQTLNVSDVHVTGPFQQSNNCKPTVLPGKSCTISVAFKPTKGGDATGAVTITDDAFNSPQVISLSGVGTIVKVTPTAVTFGPQSVGTTSPPQPINVSNVGNVVLNVSSITITGQNAADFAETDNCTPTVAKQTSCTINVTFTPHGTGTRFATLNINDDGGASPQTVTLTGTGQ